MKQSLLRVLTYHRVVDVAGGATCNPTLLSASPRVFERQMRMVAKHFRVLSCEEVLDALAAGRRLPDRAVMITFDDAYSDFGEIAWPVLRRFALPVTLFVPTAYPGERGREFWWDRLYRSLACAQIERLESTPLGPLAVDTPASLVATVKRLQRHLKSISHADALHAVDQLCDSLGSGDLTPPTTLTWPDLRSLAAEGVTIAPHTRTHPVLTTISRDEARREMRESRADLERELGACAPVLAYPAGAYDPVIERIAAEEGFRLAFTTDHGHNVFPPEHPHRLCRTNVTPRTSALALSVRLQAWAPPLERWRRRVKSGWRRMPPPVMSGSAERLPAGGTPDAPVKVAYIMSRFPKLSETFVLYEMLAVAGRGVQVEVYPLLRQRERVVHREVELLVARAHFTSFLSRAILRANWHYIVRRPATYVALWKEVLSGTWGSPNFFVGGVAILPKVVAFAREMEREGVGHVHAHFANHPALAALIVHRLTGIPYSFTAHGSDLHVDRRMLDRKIAAASFAVTISEFNKRLMLRECGPGTEDKIRVVHCGVDPSVFSVSGSGEPGDAVSIACVASFEQVKGHRFLVDACRLLRQRGVRFTCVFVGEGPLRRDVERQIARHDLGDLVIVRGGCTQAEVVQVLSGSDIVALASAPTRNGKREGIPVALMEAMAAGRPVVATTTGGVPELVEDRRTGLLVPPADPAALADALETLARDPLMRRAFGVAGREKVLREFSLHSSATALADMFAVSAAAARTRAAMGAQLQNGRGALVEGAARQAASLPARR